MDISTYNRGGYERNILLLSNGEVVREVTYSAGRREVTNLGNFKTGTCWEGDAIKVVSIKQVLDEWKVEYTLPPVFKHVAEYNRFHDCLLVQSLVIGEEVEVSVEAKPSSTMLIVTWSAPYMELTPEVMEAIYKVAPLKKHN